MDKIYSMLQSGDVEMRKLGETLIMGLKENGELGSFIRYYLDNPPSRPLPKRIRRIVVIEIEVGNY